MAVAVALGLVNSGSIRLLISSSQEVFCSAKANLT